jgi:hypothetical protein
MLNGLRRLAIDREDEAIRLGWMGAPEPIYELGQVDVMKHDAAKDDVEVAGGGENGQGDLARPDRHDIVVPHGLNKSSSGERITIDHEHLCAPRSRPAVARVRTAQAVETSDL